MTPRAHIPCLLFLATALLGLGACMRNAPTAQPGPGAGIGPGPMLVPTAIAERFLWRQRVTASWGDRSETFDAVLQMDGEELILMGLGPMGRPGFIATLGASGLRFENRSGRSLPIAAEHILADVQKVFYPDDQRNLHERAASYPCVSAQRRARPGRASSALRGVGARAPRAATRDRGQRLVWLRADNPHGGATESAGSGDSI